MKKIILLDLFSVSNFHEIFNFCFLYSLLNGNKNREIEYYADSSVIRLLEKRAFEQNININQVIFHTKSVNKGQKSHQIFYRFFRECLYELQVIFNSKNVDIVLSHLNPFIGLLYPLWKRTNNKIYIVCHGELEYIISNPRFYKPMNFYKFCIKKFLKYTLTDNLSLIVLGNSIKINLLKYTIPDNYTKIRSMKHPYIFEDTKENVKINYQYPIKIGFIGSVSKEKGLHDIFKLSEYFKNNILEKKLEIYIIGSNNLDVNNYPLIKFIKNKDGSYLPYNKFQEAVHNLDYICYFYPTDSYKLIASGAFFDAINHKKPIIALHNDYFLDIEKNYGKFGYLCSTKSEIINIISYLITNVYNSTEDNSKFYQTIENIRNAYFFKNIILKL